MSSHPFKQGLSIVTLAVDDLGEAQAFYQALGWSKHASSQDGIVFYLLNQQLFALYPRADFAKEFDGAENHLGTGSVTLAQNFATKAEVDQAFSTAIDAGANSLKAPQEVFWGGYSGYFADPDGHVWELAMNPFVTVGPNGELSFE